MEKRMASIITAMVIILVLGIFGFLAVTSLQKKAVDDYKKEIAERSQKASEETTEQRFNDMIKNHEKNKEYVDEIAKAEAANPNTEMSAPARALACKRLRDHGITSPSCRPEGSN